MKAIDGTGGRPMKHTLAVCTLLLGFLALSAQAASAQLRIYMSLGDIQGSSTDENHPDWIELRGIRQVFEPDSLKKGCEIEVLKSLDVAGPRLWRAAVVRSHLPEAAIEVVASGDRPVTIYEIKLRDLIIAAISTEGTSTFEERVTLVADHVTLIYRRLLPDGTFGGLVSESWRCNY
jgi:type VI protein secretion system component Hcp